MKFDSTRLGSEIRCIVLHVQSRVCSFAASCHDEVQGLYLDLARRPEGHWERI